MAVIDQAAMTALDPAALDDTEILTLTLWGESRGCSDAGRRAIANVILNRVALRASRIGPATWGRTIKDVCLAPYQYSCWLPDDPNRAKMLNPSTMTALDAAAMKQCRAIADEAIQGGLIDNTNDADSYLVTSIASRTSWARGKTPVAVIGAHSFYRLYGPPQAPAAIPVVAEAASPAVSQDAIPARLADTAGALAVPPDVEQIPAAEAIPPKAAPNPTNSRTMASSAVGGAGILSWLSIDTIYDRAYNWFANDKDALDTLWAWAPALDRAKWWIMVGLAVAFAVVVYARWSDHRKGVR